MMHELSALDADLGGRGASQLACGIALIFGTIVLLALVLPIALVGALVPTGPPRPAAQAVTGNRPDNPSDPAAQEFGSGPVDVARRYLGVPYVFGGTNPAIGLDCSGLVQLVFRQLGIALPRTAQQQYGATRRIARDELQPGDLVFFARTYSDPNDWITHVGIYVADGQQINAPTTGQVVSIQPIFSGFWGAHFAGAGRVART